MKALAMSLEVPAFFLGKSISKHVLRRVVGLKDPMRKIFLALYGYGKPATAVEIAEPLGYTRTYVSKRLNQLELIGLVKRSKAGTKVLFEVVL
jgi:predicted transcriptional regulator